MIYKAFLKQNGKGCDYTIGCGQTVITIEAENIIEAEKKLSEIIEKQFSGENELKSCELYEINNIVNYNLAKLYNRINADINNMLKLDKDFLEYQRWKAKYEKS